MKSFAIALGAMLIGTTAFAQDTTTTIKREEGVFGNKTTIEKRTEPSTSTEVTTGTVCSSETKQKTDSMGQTTTTKRTDC